MKIYVFLIFCLLTINVKSQSKDGDSTILMNFNYDYSYFDKFTKSYKTVEYEAYVVGSDKIFYVDHNQFKSTVSRSPIVINQSGKEMDSSSISSQVSKFEQIRKNVFEKQKMNFRFLDISNRVHVQHLFMIPKDYYIDIVDSLNEMNWRLIDSVKLIHNIKCQKAIGKLHEQTYEAWFAGDIKISGGPGKLFGLPGLILEATSIDGAEKYTNISISIPPNKFIDIRTFLFSKEKISFEDFKAFNEKQFKNIQMFTTQ